MKKAQMTIIALLSVIGLLLLASEPVEGVNWLQVMLWKSLAGFGCWGLAAWLYRRWDNNKCKNDI